MNETAADVQGAAEQLRALGYAICKPDPRAKSPTYRGWSTRSLEPGDFAGGDQIGAIGGPLSDGLRPGHALVIVDLDALDAVRLADRHVPSTSMSEGRPGKPRAHRYYLVPCDTIPRWACSTADQAARAAEELTGHPGPFLKHFTHRETKTGVLDFIGTGGQVVCPPATWADPADAAHVERREWTGGVPGAAAVVPFLELWRAVCELASECGAQIPDVVPRPHGPRPATQPTNVLARASKYLATCPPAVSGQNGHSALFWAARVLVYGFDLDESTATRFLETEYAPKCLPANWTARELAHKVEDADRIPFGKPRGWLRDTPPPVRARPSAAEPPSGDGGPPDEPAAPAPDEPPPRPELGELWSDPHRLARLYLARPENRHADLGALVQWRAEYHRWAGGAWLPIADADLDAELARHCREVFTADYPARLDEAQRAAEAEGQDRPRKPPTVYPVTTAVKSNTRLNLSGLCNLPDGGATPPFWLDGRDGPDPAVVIAAPNGLFRLGDLAHGGRAFSEPTPAFFSPNALPFAVPRDAGQPVEWLRLVGEWFSGDAASIAGLQEWFGYLLSAETCAHKALMLVGPKRSGKGTIMRVLTALVGAANVASTSFLSLGESFGLEDLLGKRVALIPDARMSARADLGSVVERILSISGEDPQSVNRKNRTRVTVRLGSRFVIATNVMPQLPDPSGAFASRFHILNTPNTWFGREDHKLEDKLKSELPAILKWAAQGWVRLSRNDMVFTPNEAAASFSRELEDLSSPVKAFVRQRCSVGPERSVDTSEIYATWVAWNKVLGKEHITAQNVFGRDLRAAFPHVRKGQRRDGGARVEVYRGVSVREEWAWGEEDNAEAA